MMHGTDYQYNPNLPSDMPGCHCGKFVDSGFKIQSLQFPNLHQCGNCGGFKQINHQADEANYSGGESNASGLHPLKHAVLILPYEVEEVTKGGILLPTQIVERDQLSEQRGVIIDVGAQADIGDAHIGDKVLFSKWSGQTAIGTLDGKTYRVVNDRDIFLKIEDNENVGQT